MFKRISIALLTLAIVFPVFAQDATEAPTPDATEVVVAPPATVEPPPVVVVNNPPSESHGISSEVLFLVVSVIGSLVLVIALQNSTIRSQATQLGVSAPEWAWQGGKSLERSLMDSLETKARETPEPDDDESVARARKAIDEYIAEVDAKRATQNKAMIDEAVRKALNSTSVG